MRSADAGCRQGQECSEKAFRWSCVLYALERMSGCLDRVNVPADLKNLSLEELESLSGEVRRLIIDTVSKTGGHLAASLGVVDLTIDLDHQFGLVTIKIYNVWLNDELPAETQSSIFSLPQRFP